MFRTKLLVCWLVCLFAWISQKLWTDFDKISCMNRFWANNKLMQRLILETTGSGSGYQCIQDMDVIMSYPICIICSSYVRIHIGWTEWSPMHHDLNTGVSTSGSYDNCRELSPLLLFPMLF